MTTDAGVHPHQSVPPDGQVRRGVHVGRLVLGVLVGAAGIGWLLDEAGMDVPWRLYPAAAVTVIGLALLATLLGGRGRALLIGLGLAALVAAVAVGVGADQYTGPVGDRFVAPTVAQWPVDQQVSAGTVTVDLTRYPLPETGTATIDVGAGRVLLVLPADDSRLAVDAGITAGAVHVDGQKVADGVDVRWSQPAGTSAPVQVRLQVGLGEIEVNHEQP